VFNKPNPLFSAACWDPLGMESEEISDEQLCASSAMQHDLFFTKCWDAKYARLNKDGLWVFVFDIQYRTRRANTRCW